MTKDDYLRLDALHARDQVSEVVSGKARGADTCGETWAKRHGLPIKPFPADWNKYKKGAGPVRNGQMARYAQAAALFPGGSGTADMHRQANTANLVIYEFRQPLEPRQAPLPMIRGEVLSPFMGMVNRRFTFDPHDGRMILGGDDVSKGSHSQEYFDRTGQAKDRFDACVRGWTAGKAKGYPGGIIHFAPHIVPNPDPETLDAAIRALKDFLQRGANEKTILRNCFFCGEEPEQTLGKSLLRTYPELRASMRPPLPSVPPPRAAREENPYALKPEGEGGQLEMQM